VLSTKALKELQTSKEFLLFFSQSDSLAKVELKRIREIREIRVREETKI